MNENSQVYKAVGMGAYIASFCFYLAITLISLAIIIILGFYQIQTKKVKTDYVETSGEVIETIDSSHYLIKYDIDGIAFQETLFSAKEYNLNDKILIFYDPNDTSHILDEPDTTSNTLIFFGVALLFFIASLLKTINSAKNILYFKNPNKYDYVEGPDFELKSGSYENE